MKTFPTLYKRAKTGTIQFWSLSVIDHQGGYPEIRKTSGKLNTQNPVIHGEFVKEGKNLSKSNETTALQQALSQAESDWKKKRDEGYKSLSDLGASIVQNKPGFYASSKGFYNLQETLEMLLPQFNTDASGNVKPMLAKAVDWKKVKYPCMVQPKLDGVRCLMIVQHGVGVTFISRSGKEYTTLEHIRKDVVNNLDGSTGNFILDGEIYSSELTFQEIIAAVKKQRADSLKLKFRAYDVVNDEIQDERWQTTKRLVQAILSTHITYVDTFEVDTQEEVKQLHDKWVSEGYEGAMVRHLTGLYGQGQRSSDLLKVKEFDDSEFKCITLEKGQRDEDLIAVCVYGDKEFRAKLIGNREYKAELWKNGHLVSGKMLTVKHFGWTDDGLPRFPIGKAFRDE